MNSILTNLIETANSMNFTNMAEVSARCEKLEAELVSSHGIEIPSGYVVAVDTYNNTISVIKTTTDEPGCYVVNMTGCIYSADTGALIKSI